MADCRGQIADCGGQVVVDTSVLVAVILQERSTPRLVESTQGASLMVPPSVHWEVGNALVAALRRRRITLNDAVTGLHSYSQNPIRFVDVDLSDGLELAESHGTYAYDAFVLSCAQRYRRPLLTLDSRMKEAALDMGINLVEI